MPKNNAPPAEGMQRIHWSIKIGLVGCKQEGLFDIEVDAEESEIEERAKDAAFDCVDWNWTREGED